MKKILLLIGSIIFIVILVFYIQSVRSKKNRDKVEKMCAHADSIYGQGFSVSGFTYDQAKNILVKELSNNILKDSFIIHPRELPYDSIRKRYEGNINRGLDIKNVYTFYIPGQKPYVLSNITLVVQTHPSLLNKTYDCDILSYELNGKIFYNGYFDLKKEGYEFPWEK